ncbi:hypothetical protein [Streptomyces aurantiogriseus]|nr:hypothetical protein [Streptomyces aurantiogriseus]
MTRTRAEGVPYAVPGPDAGAEDTTAGAWFGELIAAGGDVEDVYAAG